MAITTSNFTIRLDNQKRDAFEKLTRDLGMSMNTAINVFISAAIRRNGFPFDVAVDPLSDPILKSAVDKELEERLAIADSPDATYVSHAQAKEMLGL